MYVRSLRAFALHELCGCNLVLPHTAYKMVPLMITNDDPAAKTTTGKWRGFTRRAYWTTRPSSTLTAVLATCATIAPLVRRGFKCSGDAHEVTYNWPNICHSPKKPFDRDRLAMFSVGPSCTTVHSRPHRIDPHGTHSCRFSLPFNWPS